MRGRASRIFVIAATWTFAWLLFWGMFVGAIAIVDPDSVDPGEGTMLFVVFGPMGLLTGLAIGAILTISAETTLREVSLARAAVWGFSQPRSCRCSISATEMPASPRT